MLRYLKNLLVKLLLLALVALVVLAIIFIRNPSASIPSVAVSVPPTVVPTQIPIPSAVQSVTREVTLGEETRVSSGLYNAPDTRTSFLNGNLYLSSDTKGWKFKVTDIADSALSRGLSVVAPDNTEREDGSVQRYRAPGLVLEVSPGNICAFTHTEYWGDAQTNFPFSAEIEVMCGPNGNTFSTPVTILQGQSGTTLQSDKVTGVGQPCGLVIGQDLYLYYTDWDSGVDAIHVARAPLSNITDPAAWQKYLDGEFDSPGLGGISTAVVSRSTTQDLYAALCSASWNEWASAYLMSYETQLGIYFAWSDDGISWHDNQLVVDYATYRTENTWVGYFTPLSFQYEDQLITGQTGVFVYAKRINGLSQNTVYQMPFAFS